MVTLEKGLFGFQRDRGLQIENEASFILAILEVFSLY